MATQFATLLTVGFVHDYFGGGRYTSFTITPTPATQTQLLRLGLIYKTQPGGFFLLFDAQLHGSPRSREQVLENAEELVFNIINTDPALLTYTADLSDGEELGKSVFCFTNRSGDAFRTGLQTGEKVGSADKVKLTDYPEKFFSKPFGQIRIALHDELPAAYQIRFGAQSTHWRYLLVSDHLKALEKPAVINKETGEAFIGPQTIALPGSREAIAFYSEKPVMLTAQPNKSFQLVENYDAATGRFRVVKGVLPNPIVGAISHLPQGDTTVKLNFSEILL